MAENTNHDTPATVPLFARRTEPAPVTAAVTASVPVRRWLQRAAAMVRGRTPHGAGGDRSPSSSPTSSVGGGPGGWGRWARCRGCGRPETLHCPGCATCWPDDTCAPWCATDAEHRAQIAWAVERWEDDDDLPPAVRGVRGGMGGVGERLCWSAVYADPAQAAEIGVGAGWFVTAIAEDDEPRVVLAVELGLNEAPELAAQGWAELLAAQLAIALPRVGGLPRDYDTATNATTAAVWGRR